MDLELSNLSVDYLEQLYEQYCRDRMSVSDDWRDYFDGLTEGNGRVEAESIGPSFAPTSIFNPHTSAGPVVEPGEEDLWIARLQERVDQLIRNYRVRGHNAAKIDPLGRPRPKQPELDPSFYEFTEEDLDRPVSARTIRGSNVQTLRDIIHRFDDTYCNRIGAQFMHIDELDVRDWLQRRLEDADHRLRLSREQQVRILTKLTDAILFEQFVRRKYVGAKTFSLEGAESLIPLLDMAIEKLVSQGTREVVMGMSHRGRLNVLANTVGKNLKDIFREFEDVDPDLYTLRGDVKYHLGYHNYVMTSTGKEVHISLGFNPSHLEYVNPVTLGRLRAKQDRFGDSRREVAAGILIHGDAAFSGEGIVQETLNLSQLPGYCTGGTLHIIVNNQIGFTTTPEESRSCNYATDVAKMLQIPIFHVNGENPEAVAQVVDLALDFRHEFKRDVVIDMYCYRRWGHNEGDEPMFTQPQMYEQIGKRESVRDGYLARLQDIGGITRDEADAISERRQEVLEDELSLARRDDFVHNPGTLETMWDGYVGQEECYVTDDDTGVPKEQLVDYLNRLTTLPEGFTPHKKLQRVLENRRAMARGEKPLDWATAEALAFASLLMEGARVRLSGQDCQRGTFSHRHAVLHDVKTGQRYMSLEHLDSEQASIEIHNSPLSEAGVLGFDYGYSLAFPDGLVIWEAQFGDFVNVAQVIIDQFIASAEDKWSHLSGITMLLPHGYEGQGPEHSSARLERFLILAAEDNMQIAQPSTPAQYFHLLRRQVVRKWRKPLVVFTPKSLLRNPKTVSPLDECTTGRFHRVLPDTEIENGATKRILLCSGKIYYELMEERQRLKRTDVAIVRVEQYYPLADSRLASALQPYADETPVFWVQEEPANMGAWRHFRSLIGDRLLGRFPFAAITRPVSSSPATGSSHSHRLEQQKILEEAFAE